MPHQQHLVEHTVSMEVIVTLKFVLNHVSKRLIEDNPHDLTSNLADDRYEISSKCERVSAPLCLIILVSQHVTLHKEE